MVSDDEKDALIGHILNGTRTASPTNLDIYVTDRCNVDCYFCSQIDVRTTQELPVPKLVSLLRSMAPRGLKSIRFGGGGDPLAHRQIVPILDALAETPVQLENVTTNGVGLSAEVAERLVALRCTDILISLNAASAAEYARMMQVRGRLFTKVTENIRRLRAIREHVAADAPVIIVQFLLDRANCESLGEMYALGRSLGPDIIVFNVVRPTAHTPHELLLQDEDLERFSDDLLTVLEADREEQRVLVCFPYARWNQWLAGVAAERGFQIADGVTTAPSYSESVGRCFFGWYTAVITGAGEVFPCCALSRPGYRSLGNIHENEFESIWSGPEFDRLRHEMREVFLTDGHVRPEELQRLVRDCVAENACWLKTFTFRHDEAFYSKLKAAVERRRAGHVI
ncbi:MAG TPA: radical SAM protein [Thermoanaerobaculia bacterium]|nr:radical SAM protein [Thermoanaerobaculia bacterium]